MLLWSLDTDHHSYPESFKSSRQNIFFKKITHVHNTTKWRNPPEVVWMALTAVVSRAHKTILVAKTYMCILRGFSQFLFKSYGFKILSYLKPVIFKMSTPISIDRVVLYHLLPSCLIAVFFLNLIWHHFVWFAFDFRSCSFLHNLKKTVDRKRRQAKIIKKNKTSLNCKHNVWGLM